MNTIDFTNIIKEVVVKYFNDHVDQNSTFKLQAEQVHIIDFNFVLGNVKGTAVTDIPDGMYYVVTYESAGNMLYIEVYKKWDRLAYNLAPAEQQTEDTLKVETQGETTDNKTEING